MALCLVFVACEKEEITNDTPIDITVENSETSNTRSREADVDHEEIEREFSANMDLVTKDNNHFTASLSDDGELSIVWEPLDKIEDDIPNYISRARAKSWAIYYYTHSDPPCVDIAYFGGGDWAVYPC